MEHLVREIKRFESLRRRYDVSPSVVRAFRGIVYTHYEGFGRDFPWRRTRNPYRILVSEYMLQQTQTSRVRGKYAAFLKLFPTVQELAEASRSEVLKVWQGLGYNRRAVSLHEAARQIMKEHQGRVPREREALLSLPGAGQSTAGAVQAFAFGVPGVIIETNIRRVVLHHFFPDARNVRDIELIPLIERTLDRDDPRQWYYALMDYGVDLARAVVNPNQRSAHHSRQSPFEGSKRQLRGQVLRMVLDKGGMHEDELVRSVGKGIKKVREVVLQLEREGFLIFRKGAVLPRNS